MRVQPSTGCSRTPPLATVRLLAPLCFVVLIHLSPGQGRPPQLPQPAADEIAAAKPQLLVVLGDVPKDLAGWAERSTRAFEIVRRGNLRPAELWATLEVSLEAGLNARDIEMAMRAALELDRRFEDASKMPGYALSQFESNAKSQDQRLPAITYRLRRSKAAVERGDVPGAEQELADCGATQKWDRATARIEKAIRDEVKRVKERRRRVDAESRAAVAKPSSTAVADHAALLHLLEDGDPKAVLPAFESSSDEGLQHIAAAERHLTPAGDGVDEVVGAWSDVLRRKPALSDDLRLAAERRLRRTLRDALDVQDLPTLKREEFEKRLGELPASQLPEDLLALPTQRMVSVLGVWKHLGLSWESSSGIGDELRLDAYLPTEFDLLLTVERISEKPDFFAVGVPVGKQRAVLCLDGIAGKRSWLEHIDGRGDGNPTTVAGTVFVKGQPRRILICVRTGEIDVSIDDKDFTSWRGDPAKFTENGLWKVGGSQAPARTLLLGSSHASYRISSVWLLPPATPSRR